MAKSLKRRLLVTIRAVQTLTNHFPYLMLKKLEFRVTRIIQKISQQFNFQPKQAPLIFTNDAFRIAQHLWEDETRTRGTRQISIRNRKKAAVVTVLASLSGSRWIDLHRLRWEDIKLESTPFAKFLYIGLRMSKNNLSNEVPQRLFWAVKTDTVQARNPIFWLQRFWNYQGRPSQGFMFNPENSTIPDTTWGSHTINQVRRSAKILGFPENKWPTRHSFRVTMAITLYNMGIDSHRINRFMNWKTNRMQEHYVNTRDSKSIHAPANQLASLSSHELEVMQEQFL